MINSQSLDYLCNKKMLNKLVAIEPVSLIASAEDKLYTFAEQVIMYDSIPQNNDEIVERIGDADAVLLSYTSNLGKEAIEKCPNIKYIGMCNSLYSPESANVDILYANSRNITVTGIRDYGDEGVVEYVVSELVRCLHGFGVDRNGMKEAPWNGVEEEITGMTCGIVGLGKSGGMIADALSFFGAKIYYYARSEKEWAKEKGYIFAPLNEVLEKSEAIFCCLNKNTILLHEEQFESLGNHKLLFNTGLSPAWDEEPFAKWIEGDNRCYCDTQIALGNKEFMLHRNVRCMDVSTGRTRQAFDRLSEKVLTNISEYLSR